MNHLNLNFEAKNIAGICNVPETEAVSNGGVLRHIHEAVNDICKNISDYQFDCDKCSEPHKSIHRGKVLQRLMRDVDTHNEQLLVFASLEHIMDTIYDRVDSSSGNIETLLLKALASFKKHQA
jgi:flavoprotein